MPRREDDSNGLREAVIAAHESGMGYENIQSSKFCSEKDYSLENIPQKNTPTSDLSEATPVLLVWLYPGSEENEAQHYNYLRNSIQFNSTLFV